MTKKNTYHNPTNKDLEIWKNAYPDLTDWLYKGLTGKFQIKGHFVIGKWSRVYKNKIVLEIGCGHGPHLIYGKNSYSYYIGLDVDYRFTHTLTKRFSALAVNGDAYHLPFKKNSLDCVLSIFNFEHLKQLDLSLDEIHRTLKPEGELIVGLPAEGGFLYGLGRSLTSKPYMEKKYGINYDAIVHYEHCNTYRDIIASLRQKFNIIEKRFIPFYVHSVHLNAIICMRAQPIDNRWQ